MPVVRILISLLCRKDPIYFIFCTESGISSEIVPAWAILKCSDVWRDIQKDVWCLEHSQAKWNKEVLHATGIWNHLLFVLLSCHCSGVSLCLFFSSFSFWVYSPCLADLLWLPLLCAPTQEPNTYITMQTAACNFLSCAIRLCPCIQFLLAALYVTHAVGFMTPLALLLWNLGGFHVQCRRAQFPIWSIAIQWYHKHATPFLSFFCNLLLSAYAQLRTFVLSGKKLLYLHATYS